MSLTLSFPANAGQSARPLPFIAPQSISPTGMIRVSGDFNDLVTNELLALGSGDRLAKEIESQGEHLREGLRVIIDDEESLEAQGVLELYKGRWSARIISGTLLHK